MKAPFYRMGPPVQTGPAVQLRESILVYIFLIHIREGMPAETLKDRSKKKRVFPASVDATLRVVCRQHTLWGYKKLIRALPLHGNERAYLIPRGQDAPTPSRKYDMPQMPVVATMYMSHSEGTQLGADHAHWTSLRHGSPACPITTCNSTGHRQSETHPAQLALRSRERPPCRRGVPCPGYIEGPGAI